MRKKLYNSCRTIWFIFLIVNVNIIFLSPNLLGQHQLQLQKKGEVNAITLKSESGYISTVPISAGTILDNNIEKFIQEKEMPDATWVLKFTAPGKVFKDVSFANSNVGYIVTELGSVYKSTNGGDNWTSVMNLGFPYYWYGVFALSPDTVVISGFNNQAPIGNGVIRWTFNGGSTWGSDISLTKPGNGVGWLERVHFFNADTGIVINSFSGGCWYTTTGGKNAASWTYININSDMGWIAGNIDALASGQVFVTGIHLARSTNFGLNWNSGPSADNTFDGGVDFVDNNNLFGWTGGGQISAPVSGWVCRTTNSGTSWSPRLNTFPYPIRAVHFLDENKGWVFGGNLYDEAGGIYFTTDGGITWNQEVNTVAEMFSFDIKKVSADSMDVWCVGSTGGSTGYNGKLYKTRIGSPITGIDQNQSIKSSGLVLFQNFPNPFDQETSIGFTLPIATNATLKVFDVLGNEIKTIFTGKIHPGYHSFQFNVSGLQNGVYYYQLTTDDFKMTKKMILKR